MESLPEYGGDQEMCAERPSTLVTFTSWGGSGGSNAVRKENRVKSLTDVYVTSEIYSFISDTIAFATLHLHPQSEFDVKQPLICFWGWTSL